MSFGGWAPPVEGISQCVKRWLRSDNQSKDMESVLLEDEQEPDAGLYDVPLNQEILGDVLRPGGEFFKVDAKSLFRTKFDYNDLDPKLADGVREVVRRCKTDGYKLVPYFGLRTPWEQAKLYRQSRSTAEINSRVQELRSNGAPFLAEVLDSVGPQPSGPKVTNAPPGLSWHQWSEAVDSYWWLNGQIEWFKTEGYKVYADHARALGLTAGFYWSDPDLGHVQLRSVSSPRKTYSFPEIDDTMRERFQSRPTS